MQEVKICTIVSAMNATKITLHQGGTNGSIAGGARCTRFGHISIT